MGKGMKKPGLCLLDRDGVLNRDKAYLYKKEDVEWIEGCREAVAFLNGLGCRVIVVTNQSGVARGYFTEAEVRELHGWMAAEIAQAGGVISAFYYCPHLPGAPVAAYDKECDCRKPKPGMIRQALRDWGVSPEKAFLIGDSPRDVEAAEAAGIRGYLFREGSLLDFVQQILEGEIMPGIPAGKTSI